MAIWEEKAKARIRAAIRKYVKVFEDQRRTNKLEADVGNRVYDMLAEAFGYDKTKEITAEYRVRGQFADYAVLQDSKVKFFVEVKGPGVKLNPRHLLQVTMYAVKEAIEWVVLTNGMDWQLYHIGKALPIAEELAFSCNLAEDDRSEAVACLFVLSREAMKRNAVEEYWNRKLAVSAPNLIRVLYSDEVVERMRKGLRALTGYRATVDELRALLERDVVRQDFAGQASRMKKRSRRTKGGRGKRGARQSNEALEPSSTPL